MKRILSVIFSILLTLIDLVAQDFTVMIIPDTQFQVMDFSYMGSNINQFTAQMDWVPAKKDNLNIQFICHVGDAVDHADNTNEWTRFKAGWQKIEASGIPWSIAPGNHDTDLPMGSDSWNIYNSNYPASSWMQNSWAIETYPNGKNENNLSFFNASGMEFMVISIGYALSTAEYNWAVAKLAAYPNKRAIISTHDVNNGKIIDLAKQSTNVFLIVSGHYCGPEWYNTYTNAAGITIHEIMSDYQCSLNGFLRYYTFKPAEDKIYAYTYNPLTNTYRTGTSSQFIMDYKMATPTSPQISAVKNTPNAVKSTDVVTVSATVTDDKSISSVTLSWGLSSVNLSNSVAMTASGDTYSATIPAQVDGSTVYYKVLATDNENNSSSSESSYKVSDNPDVCFVDYDATDLNFTGFGGSNFSKVANPSPSGINTSAMVGKCVKDAASQTWAGIYSATLSSKIDFSVNKFFKMKVNSPKVCKVLMKLEDAANSNAMKEVEVTTTQLNAWEELVFDFSGSASNTYNKITLFFDFGATTGNAFYFDDICMVSDLSTVIVENPGLFKDLKIYPNPVDDELNIQNSISLEEVHIHNITGQLVESIYTYNTHIKISTIDLPKGIYIITIRAYNKVLHQKFVKE
ncbi:MAG: T9SS type A sorting domain-containing protein [Bacteroidetes bacterium]|nr:T9SS type A sorting domain-containing protein [Bacteroidota bacterium]